ncbi:MAG: biotin--[acetyl-CoA-carboxylase] ligase [Epulopiscium sp.]|nr:biotin--[acetyl-CoA-carboxylase] ligase [Candidatus Epulonipiscium sp.]
MKGHVLRLLQQANDYISGEAISQDLGVSRTAIWKVMQQLKEEGYQLESSPRKGYRLLSSPDRITPEEIRTQLKTSYLGHEIQYEEVLDSTNQRAKALAAKGAVEGTIVLAEQQERGKGRMGRQWESPKGTGIWLSAILRPLIPPTQVPLITLFAGLSVCKALEVVTGCTPSIKWPNDIILQGKKVCGILTEMNGEMERIHYVVVGIGVNVNTTEFIKELEDRATSLYLETGVLQVRKVLVAEILYFLEQYYESFKNPKKHQELLNEYKKYCITIGQDVKVMGLQETFFGRGIDLTAEGELLVRRETGIIETIRSGEVSIRGTKGYL